MRPLTSIKYDQMFIKFLNSSINSLAEEERKKEFQFLDLLPQVKIVARLVDRGWSTAFIEKLLLKRHAPCARTLCRKYVCSFTRYHSASSHLAGSDRASGGGPHKGIPHPRRQHHRPAGPRPVRRHHTAGMSCAMISHVSRVVF